MTKTYAIHPAIGVARMGNLDLDLNDPDSYYVGPEALFEVPNVGKTYKKGGRIKKQAQRFRIYEYEDGQAVREITLSEVDVAGITWTVHLGNRKAALDTAPEQPAEFAQPTHPPQDFHPSVTRNTTIIDPERRKKLCIDSGVQTVPSDGSLIELAGSFEIDLGQGAPIGKPVQLGSAASDPETGHLLVFAGEGLSEGVLDGEFSQHAPFKNEEGIDVFANSDNWYDQSADGPVQASITFASGETVPINAPEHSSWVICAMPKYAPALNYFTDLYDVARSASWPAGQGVPKPSFANDIFPILRSVSLLQWVTAKGAMGHRTGSAGFYMTSERMQVLGDNNADPDSVAYKSRNSVFARLRNPAKVPVRPGPPLTAEQTKPLQMPQLPNDVLERPGAEDWDISAVTPLQYQMLKKWRDGDFIADGIYDVRPFEQIATSDQPAALNRAALFGSSGTPFYPGIESWLIMTVPELYAAPFRIKGDSQPGDLTMGNALPWQADYLDCTDTWWPVQRPEQVTRNGQPMQDWVPDSWGGETDDPDYGQMVRNWWQLGFVIGSTDGATYYETERNVGDEA